MSDETRTTLRIPNDLKEELRKEATKENRSIHNLIITILKERMERDKVKARS